MAIKFKHDDSACFYFCTFTCYSWLPLIELTNSYDVVYKWFEFLKSKNMHITSYVIMPNHVHVLLYFPLDGFQLNKLIGNGKRFIAYEITKRLKALNAWAYWKAFNQAYLKGNETKGSCIKYLKRALMQNLFTPKNSLTKN